MHKEPIDDPAHPALADYRAVREPELARARGVFIAEGRLVVRRLLTRSPLVVRSVLATPTALLAIGDALGGRPDLQVFVVSPEVMHGVTGFNIHRGCLAAGLRPPPADWRFLVADVRRMVVLEQVGDADNVGAIVRSASALGAGGVLFGPGCADPLYRKAIRTSMGSVLTLPFATIDPWPHALGELGARGWAVAAMTPHSDALTLREFAASAAGGRVALVLGHEGHGLSPGAMAACSHRVRIPIGAGVDSLNVATSGAIALYELGRDTP